MNENFFVGAWREDKDVFQSKKRQTSLDARIDHRRSPLETDANEKRRHSFATATRSSRQCNQKQNLSGEDDNAPQSQKVTQALSPSANASICSQAELGSMESFSSEKDTIPSSFESSSNFSQAGSSFSEDCCFETHWSEDEWKCSSANSSGCSRAGSEQESSRTPSSAKQKRLSLSRNSCGEDPGGSLTRDDRFEESSTCGKADEASANGGSCKIFQAKRSLSATSNLSTQIKSAFNEDGNDTRSVKEGRVSLSTDFNTDTQSESLVYKDRTGSNSERNRKPFLLDKRLNQRQHSTPYRSNVHPNSRISCFIPAPSCDEAHNLTKTNISNIPKKNAALDAPENSGFVFRKRVFPVKNNFDPAQNWTRQRSNCAPEHKSKMDSDYTPPSSEKSCNISFEEVNRCNKGPGPETKHLTSLQALMALEELLYGNPRSSSKSRQERISKGEELQLKLNRDNNQENLSTGSSNSCNKSIQQSGNSRMPERFPDSSPELIAVGKLLLKTRANPEKSDQMKSSDHFSDQEESASTFLGNRNKHDRSASWHGEAFNDKESRTERESSKKAQDSSKTPDVDFEILLTTKNRRLVLKKRLECDDEINKVATGKHNDSPRADGNLTGETAHGNQRQLITEKSRPVLTEHTLKSGLQAMTSKAEIATDVSGSREICSASKQEAEFREAPGGFQTVLTTVNSRLVYSRHRPDHVAHNQIVIKSQDCKQISTPKVKIVSFPTRSETKDKRFSHGASRHAPSNHKLEQVGLDDEDDVHQPFKDEHIRSISTPSESGGFPCLWCTKVFFSSFSQRRHVAKHLNKNEKDRFACRICNRGFSRKDHLKRHVLSHKNERPHQCNRCGMSFKYRNNLTRHEKRDSCFKIRKNPAVSANGKVSL